MTLTPGRRLGPYEILSAIGAGGMGEVYRAHDSRLKRDVALKVLPDAFSSDPERLARFAREAQVLASLNHPHIAQVYGIEEASGDAGADGPIRAIVMELVEGEELAGRIARGALPVDEALPIGLQVAEALEAAHEQGIVHRDLKPANIRLRPDGSVKVLDFGLAKPGEPGRVSDVSQSPTITSPAAMTGMGVILGTAAYMSPEQARGRPVDKRADIWAFGCVLFEMLTGRRAFPGDDVADTIAAVVRAEPAWDRLPPNTPPAVRRVLKRCLQKNLRDRLPDIGAARLDLQDADTERLADGAVAGPDRVTRGAGVTPWAAAAVAGLVIVAAIAATFRAPVAAEPPEVRLELQTPPSPMPSQFALSPDGTRLTAVVSTESGQALWLRSLIDGSSRILPGTSGALSPFWSPDGRMIAFFVQGRRLRQYRLSDDSIADVGDRIATQATGGSWSSAGVLLWSPAAGAAPLLAAANSGAGPIDEVTRIEPGHTSHRSPFFLPDGQRFLFRVAGLRDVQGIYLGHLASKSATRLIPDAGPAVFSRGHVLFYRDGKVYAQALSSDGLHGDPGLVIDAPAGFSPVMDAGGGALGSGAGLDATDSGLVAFRPAIDVSARELLWFDRKGNEVGRIPDAGDVIGPDLSPDGQRIAIGRVAGNDQRRHIWTYELQRGIWTLSTPGNNSESTVIWAPDGRRLVYYSLRDGRASIYIKPWNAEGETVLMEEGVNSYSARSMSRDGAYVLYDRGSTNSASDLWLYSVADRRSTPITQTPQAEIESMISPDQKWIAYRSNESGRFEIYVRPFNRPGDTVRISTNGGAQPRWRQDGKELFYVDLDKQLMAVSVQTRADGMAVDAGTPLALFRTRIAGGVDVVGGRHQQYAVSSDGQRFLVVTEPENVAPITMLLNWKPPVRAGAP